MFKTGNTFTDYLLLGVTFLPLVPVLLIFGRRLYLQEPLNFLLVICVLCFLRGFILYSDHQYLAGKIFNLLIFLPLVWVFRANLKGRVRYGVTLVLTALLAVSFTYWSLMGWSKASPYIDMVLNGFVALVIGVSLPVVVKNGNLQVFQSRLFWMEGGTLFYVLLYLLVGWAGASTDPDGRLFLVLADGVRYFLYIVAAGL